MADDTLNIKINADDSGVAPGVDDTIARFKALMATLGGASDAHDKAAESARKHAEANSILGERVERVEVATNSAARVFGVLGLQTAEATERVEGLSEALHALDGAALPLLGIGAAVLALAESFNFLKDGVEEAAKAQTAFAALGTAVRDQGGAWNDAAQDGVERFLDAIEHATTYSRGEALDALNKLVTAGASLADAEKMVAIATDVAAGSHRSLSEVVNALKEAEAGRGMGLIQLDEKLKTLVHSHADLSTILRQLSEDFRGQASAASDTFEGRLAELRNELSHVGEELGEHLLPLLTVGSEVLIGLAEQAEAHIPQITAFFDAIVNGARDAIDGFHDLQNALPWNVLSGDDWKKSGAAWQDIQKRFIGNPTGSAGPGAGPNDLASFRVGWDPGSAFMRQASQKNAESNDVVGDIIKSALEKAKTLHDEALKDLDATRAQALQHDAVVGNPGRGKKPYEAGSYDFTPADMPSFDKDADGDRQKALEDSLKSISRNELQFEANVKSATTAQQEQNAQLALDREISEDASAAIGKLNAAIAQQTAERDKLKAGLTGQEQDATRATAAYNALGAALAKESDAGTKPTKAQENALKDLKTAMDAANSSVTKTQSSIEKLNGYLDSNRAKLDDETKAARTYADALAEITRKENEYVDATAQRLSDELGKSIQEQKAREQNFEDEIATYGKSLAAQLAYYAQRYAQEVTADGEYSEQAQATQEKILSIELDEYKQREEQHQQMVQEILAQETTLVDDIISKHETLKTTIHSIWEQIGSDLEKQIESTLTGPGSVLGGFGGTLASLLGLGGFGNAAASQNAPTAIVNPLNAIQQNTAAMRDALGTGGFGGAGGAGTNASTSGIMGALLGASQAASIAGALPTNAGIIGLIFGASSAATIAGSGSSAASSSPGGGGYSGPDIGNAGGGGANWGTSSSASLSSILGSGVQGAGYGQLAAELDGGNSTYGSIGGGLGSIAALLGGVTGPAGAAVAIGGGLLGSLFGPHNQNAYGEPDIYDTQNYGQTIADLQGTAGANGQNFYESQTVKNLFNGQTALAGLEEVLAQGQQSFTTNTGLSASVYQSLLSEIGSSSTGSGQLSFGTNIGNLSVSGASGAGGTFRYTDFENLLNEYINAIQGKGGSNAIPTFSVTRSYQNPGIVNGVVSNGTFTPTASNLLGTVPGSGTVTGSTIDPTTGLPVGGTSGIGGSVITSKLPNATVSVTINGNVVGPGGLTGVAQDIATVLGRLQSGQIVGSGASSSPVYLSRFTGGS